MKTEDFMDSLADSYTRSHAVNYTQYLKYLLVKNHSRTFDSALDVGIANGITSIPLARYFKKIDGIDISEKMLSSCEEQIKINNIENIHLHQMSADTLNFPDETFDTLYCFSTFILIANPMLAMKEFYRVLRPGGLAIIDIPGKLNLSGLFWSYFYRYKIGIPASFYTYRQASRLFFDVGFKTIESVPTGFLDQWKYIPFLRKLHFIDRCFHKKPTEPDIDFHVSKVFSAFANRWYFVAEKPS